jgi:3-methyl-2-oxobutanoate hydroxymethyltransferase
MLKIISQKIKDLSQKAQNGQKLTMLTAYDFPMAAVIDECGIDIVLVGDSLANVVLGLPSTKDVGISEMLHHTKAVRRAVKNALLLGDMPFSAYQVNFRDAVKNARRFIVEAGCDAVKLEWFDDCLAVTEKLVKNKIAVMGHVGLTPQTADQLGGFKVQGKDALSAKKIIEQAKNLESAGCFSIVLECVPDQLAAEITRVLKIPTIGIGAGLHCDGQVLVTHDLLGMFSGFHPKFAKQYVDVNAVIKKGVAAFKREVSTGKFPNKDYSFAMSQQEWRKVK